MKKEGVCLPATCADDKRLWIELRRGVKTVVDAVFEGMMVEGVVVMRERERERDGGMRDGTR
jgi:hypothetical protein